MYHNTVVLLWQSLKNYCSLQHTWYHQGFCKVDKYKCQKYTLEHWYFEDYNHNHFLDNPRCIDICILHWCWDIFHVGNNSPKLNNQVLKLSTMRKKTLSTFKCYYLGLVCKLLHCQQIQTDKYKHRFLRLGQNCIQHLDGNSGVLYNLWHLQKNSVRKGTRVRLKFTCLELVRRIRIHLLGNQGHICNGILANQSQNYSPHICCRFLLHKDFPVLDC